MKKIVQIFWALSISVAIASNQLKFESLIESNISNSVSISKFGEPTSRNPQDFEGLLFSEYAEGSSYNKYLEIYNGTGADLDLSDYSISSCNNGCDSESEFDYPDNITFDSGTILSSGDVYVIYHQDADEIIVAEGDQTFTYLGNGDDAFAITLAGATASSYTIVDIIGDMG